MNVKELNLDQINELKQKYYMQKHEKVSYDELANIDDYVTNEEIVEEYMGIDFVNDDFFCTMGKDSEINLKDFVRQEIDELYREDMDGNELEVTIDDEYLNNIVFEILHNDFIVEQIHSEIIDFFDSHKNLIKIKGEN